MKTAFIGYREFLPPEIEQRLQTAIQNEIALGCQNFIMDTHGLFTQLALKTCRDFRRTYPDMRIEVVITDHSEIWPDVVIDQCGQEIYHKPTDVTTVMYATDETLRGRRIIASHQKMIDACDTLICYVRSQSAPNRAGLAMQYAAQQGKKVVNLYHPQDDVLVQTPPSNHGSFIMQKLFDERGRVR